MIARLNLVQLTFVFYQMVAAASSSLGVQLLA
jgi:hypothetical protein